VSGHEHSAWRYGDGPGRNCPGCRAAHAAYRGGLRDRHRAEAPSRNDLPHGRESTYVNHGCRCRPCANANTAAVLRRRRR